MTSIPWYNTGTVAVTNGNASVTGTGTSWLANVDQHQGFVGPDGKLYDIQSVNSDTSITLATNYVGTTVSAGSYAIAPIQGYIRQLAINAASLLNSAGALINLTPTEGQIIQYKSGAYTTRTIAQYAYDLFNNIGESLVASASTCDIGNTATTPKVQITGTNTINSFGSLANALRIVTFASSLQLTHNSSSLVLLGGQTRTTQPGDSGIYASDNSGNWTELYYSRSTGSLTVNAGSAGAPTVTFAGSATTGLYSPAANQMGVTVAGTGLANWSANGLLIGSGVNTAADLLHLQLSDSGTTNVVNVLRLEHLTSGTAAAGIGVGREAYVQNAAGTSKQAATESFSLTTATGGSEVSQYQLKLLNAGTLAAAATISGAGLLTMAGGLTLGGALTFSSGKTLAMSNNLTLAAGSDGLTLNVGAGGTLVASAYTDTTNATNISSGTLASARISGAYTGFAGITSTVSAADALTLLSGATTVGHYAQMSIGRTAADGYLRVLTQAADQAYTSGAAGDTELHASGNLLLSAAGTASLIGASSGTAFQIERSNGFLFITGDAANGNVHFPNAATTTNAANAYLDNTDTNSIKRFTSSIRIKTNVTYLNVNSAGPLVDLLKPISFTSLATGDDQTEPHFGLLAEDIADAQVTLGMDPRQLLHWMPTTKIDQTKPAPNGYASWAAYITANQQTIGGVASVPEAPKTIELAAAMTLELQHLRGMYKPVTVASLPTPSSLPAGESRVVSDALSPAYLATVAGGGSVTCRVVNNGTNWVCG